MGKLKIKRKGFGFELCIEGEVEVDQSKIKPYEDYVKEQTNLQIQQQIFKYLAEICNHPSHFKDSYSRFEQTLGAEYILNSITDHLIKNMED